MVCIVCNKEKSEKRAYKKTTCRGCYRKALHMKTEKFKLAEEQRQERKNRVCKSCGIKDQKRWGSVSLCVKCHRKEYKQIHKKELSLYMEEYRLNNKDKIKQKVKQYKEKNRQLSCHNEKLREARKTKACLPWVNKENIKKFYLNKPDNMHVDHIIPLKSNLVCGLHVDWNLQYLTPFDNVSKNNKFDGTYKNESWKK